MLLMSVHHESVLPSVVDPVCKFLSFELLVTLGHLALPIFLVHVPLGLIFYKQLVATRLFGAPMNTLCGPWFFYVYLAIVFGFAWILQKAFLTNESVATLSKKVVDKLCIFF
mmetsp:Transcript_13920/g.49037  ORF Transcript_13920/g.49037 Transcript_13920/m.49037 type:complete len:112 (+) Transcript_13920:177-512(+)